MLEFERPTEFMKRRVSCRTFTEQAIDEVTIGILEKACNRLKRTPFGAGVELGILDQKTVGGVRLGTYGTVKNPAAVLYGFSKVSLLGYAGFGFLLEQLVLLAISLGLATCWLGFYRRKGLLKALEPPGGYTIPAVSTIGYPSGRRSVYGVVAHSISAGRRRKDPSELFFEGSFRVPFVPVGGGILATALEMVRIAPSARNLQPWRLVIEGNGGRIHFFADLSETHDGRNNSLKWLDVGIAMCHLDLTMREQGVVGEWVTIDPGIAEGAGSSTYVATWVERKGS